MVLPSFGANGFTDFAWDSAAPLPEVSEHDQADSGQRGCCTGRVLRFAGQTDHVVAEAIPAPPRNQGYIPIHGLRRNNRPKSGKRPSNNYFGI